MNRLGMIVRADMGGLGNLTKSLWRHLQPDQTLVVTLPEPRGRMDTTMYAGLAHISNYPISNDTFRDMCRRIGSGGTLLTVETMYCDDAYRIAKEEGVRTILYAMPELFDAANRVADVVVVPTPWELARMPADTQVLAMPTEPAPRTRIRSECKTFLHHVAPAMLDRSGTAIFGEALQLMEETCNVIVHGPHLASDRVYPGSVHTRHNIEWDLRWHDNLWESYPPEADVMVLPRRYGGLSMPTQEAASTGLPSIMSGLNPQSWWGGVYLVDCDGSGTTAAMKGGQFAVYETKPEDLAHVMDAAVRGELDIHGLSEDALHWAASISWSNMLEDWVKLCRG